MKKTRALALSGLFTALAVIGIVLADTILIKSSLFCLLVSAFICGYSAFINGAAYGAGTLVASFLLGLLLAPGKLHCFVFLGLAVYVLLCHMLEMKSVGEKPVKKWLAFLIRFAAWTVFLAAAVVGYTVFIGDLKELITGILPERIPDILIIIILTLIGEACGLLIDPAYKQFIHIMDRHIQI